MNHGVHNPRLDRRGALRMGVQGAAALAGLSLVRDAVGQQCIVKPTQTEGPYWVDEMLNRADIRSDPATGVVQQGMPFRLSINISETTAGVCAPMAGAWVDVWHCSALGVYSDTAAQGTVGQKFLRGYQVTDSHGNVRFLTIYPGWYQGRTIHIHFRVRKFSGATTTFNFVSQIYFDQATSNLICTQQAPYNTRGVPTTTNSNDGIYNAALLSTLGYNTNHAVCSFNCVVDSVAGLVRADGAISTDEDSLEHANDLGGGMPPLTALI